ncbi:hypothetical protein [Paenibacillus lautus]|uniref:hypothetical protein n=1 Tax=Paenibacillus lautus TaxID=1401 RepID=UPI003D2A835F
MEETWRSPLKPVNNRLISSQFPGFNSDRSGYTPLHFPHSTPDGENYQVFTLLLRLIQELPCTRGG